LGDEIEGEFEDEGFLGGLLGESELEGEFEDEGEGFLGGLLGEGELEGEFEDEGEGFLGGLLGESEFEGEDEYEVSPVRKIYPDAMMEHFAHMASEAESEEDAAEHFLPLTGLAAKKLLPMVARPRLPR
jgi:hypothetical protein